MHKLTVTHRKQHARDQAARIDKEQVTRTTWVIRGNLSPLEFVGRLCYSRMQRNAKEDVLNIYAALNLIYGRQDRDMARALKWENQRQSVLLQFPILKVILIRSAFKEDLE